MSKKKHHNEYLDSTLFAIMPQEGQSYPFKIESVKFKYVDTNYVVVHCILVMDKIGIVSFTEDGNCTTQIILDATSSDITIAFNPVNKKIKFIWGEGIYLTDVWNDFFAQEFNREKMNKYLSAALANQVIDSVLVLYESPNRVLTQVHSKIEIYSKTHTNISYYLFSKKDKKMYDMYFLNRTLNKNKITFYSYDYLTKIKMKVIKSEKFQYLKDED